MIIYELTNKGDDKSDFYLFKESHPDSESIVVDLFFSKYYATKDEAVKSKRDGTRIFKHELKPLSRDDVAMILSMNHVDVFYENGWNELHDISSLVKNTIELEVS